MKKWNELADSDSVERTIKALKSNGIDASMIETSEEAKRIIFNMIPKGSEIMIMSSVTLEQAGIAKFVQESDEYVDKKSILSTMDRASENKRMQEIGATTEWTIGSVHAVTEKGQVMISSMTGSQLPAYAFGSSHVIWVVSTKKIVKNIEEGMKRIYEHVFPLENERARKVYGIPGSFVSKILIVNKEISDNRITLIFVNQPLGF